MVSLHKSPTFWCDLILSVELNRKQVHIEISTGAIANQAPGVSFPMMGTLYPDEARILAKAIKLAANIADGKLSGAEIELAIANTNQEAANA